MKTQHFLLAALPLLCVAAMAAPYTMAGTPTEAPDAVKGAPSSAEDHQCKVKCTDIHAECDESKKVIEILQKLTTAYSAGDIGTYEKYLDDNCVVFDATNHDVISGKEKVLARLKAHFTEHLPGGQKPLLSFHIDQPFAKVSDKGDTCTVTFVATKEVGGSNPHTERANVTDIFVKRGSDWKKLHWQGKWETVADK